MDVFHLRFSLVASVMDTWELLMQTYWPPLSDHWSVQSTSSLVWVCVLWLPESLMDLSALWGFATDCLCGVGCRGLTTFLLYVGPLFGHRRTRTNFSDATAVPVVTSSGDERFEFSSIYTFLFNSSRNYSLNWRHIVVNLQHPVYYCFVNNILKHEGDILHICDHIIMWF